MEEYAGNVKKGTNTLEYANGRLSTVTDGTCKYGAEYDAESDEITFREYAGIAANTVQKHKTETTAEQETKHTDTYIRGNATDETVTTTDKYGRIIKTVSGGKTAEYTYLNTDGGSSATDVLTSVYDPYEGDQYLFIYDADGNAFKRSSSKCIIEQISPTDTKYTVGSDFGKYITSVVYDEEVTATPRVAGVRNYVYKESEGKYDEVFESHAVFSWKYGYDAMGRITGKANRYDNAPDGKYTFTYMTSGNRTLPIVTSCRYEGSVEFDGNMQLFTYDMGYKYDTLGRITEETEVFDANGREDIIASDIKRTYTYDIDGHIIGENVYYDGVQALSESRTYDYNPDGRVNRIVSGADSRNYAYDDHGRRIKSLQYNGMSFMPLLSYMYIYDNYGNRIRKSYASQNGGEDNVIREYAWERGSCLTSIKDGGVTKAVYGYDRNGARYLKTVNGVTTVYYRDGNIAAIQTLGGASMVSNGLQSVFNGIRLISGACNPVSVVLGMVGVIAGVAGMAFGTAEVQEGLGCGNWIKDSGMSEGLYERSMLITGAVSLFVNIAGPIANKYGAKCFAAGTAVQTKTGTKAIEEIEVGEEVLSYDEETGTQGYKPVVRLYRNVTEEWYHIYVNGEELRCTAEHPFYVIGKGFVPARGIHSSDKVLQSDERYGIIEAVEVERLAKPEVTYNFEVAEYHTYYVGKGILTHNKCGMQNKVIFNEDIGKYKNVRMDLERGGSGKVNLHIHAMGDKFIYNGTNYINSNGQLINSVIGNSKIVANGYMKAIKYATKIGWSFP